MDTIQSQNIKFLINTEILINQLIKLINMLIKFTTSIIIFQYLKNKCTLINYILYNIKCYFIIFIMIVYMITFNSIHYHNFSFPYYNDYYQYYHFYYFYHYHLKFLFHHLILLVQNIYN